MQFERTLGRGATEGVSCLVLATGRHRPFAEAGDVPDTDSLVKRRRYDQILLGVERGAHHVMVVAGEH